ncbi:MAG: AmmeMemoRadiSam system protein B [Melioribacteraceae bacterium]|nr:AmmeMemoRadiSam system protein B [Ignavibacteriota bacterium]MBZ0184323.1 AmmeMemoRadiSam system protein B [Melioribacteraceae bacterium]
MKNIRQPYVAGMFYPRAKKELESSVEKLLEHNNYEKQFNSVKGIVAPHAGYVYSGKTAAFAFNALKNSNFETAVIISPSHREYFPGVSIYNGDAFATPLGEVQINKEKSKQLTENSRSIFVSEQGHLHEHGIEVEIPFLQKIQNDFSIIPIVMGDQSDLFVNELADKLREIIDDKTIIVASSDLSHFYTRPHADKLDSRVEKHINNFDYDELQQDLKSKTCEACGGGPIVAMMKSLNKIGLEKSKVLYRTDSGEVTRDFSEVVGYLSAVIYN